MRFNLNEFLMAISFTLDFIEMDILGVTSHHGKRTAYISYRILNVLEHNSKKLYDIVALAILHDNGVSEKSLHDKFVLANLEDTKSIERIKEHCMIGERNVKQYPFLTDVTNVIKYHHEKNDGTGLFNLKEDEIPLMSQIICMADVIEVSYELENNNDIMQKKILEFVDSQKGSMFSERIVNAFQKVASDEQFWINLKDETIDDALKHDTPQHSMELSVEEISKITGVFSRIIDSKSQYTQKHSSELSDKVAIMADFYNLGHQEKVKLIIAADLHDIGKLAVPNDILDKPGKLTKEEFEIVKKHPHLTRLALQEIKGFEDITEWASNHHEKLNGQGYPFGKSAKDLDFNSRLVACLDIYQALTEVRPYREALTHARAMEIVNEMTEDGYIDAKITKDIETVFGR